MPKAVPLKKDGTPKKSPAGRPKANIDAYFAKIREYLELGYSLNKACLYGGVPYRTMYEYQADDPDLRSKIEYHQQLINVKARRNITKAIKQGDIKVSTDWLERLEPDEFTKVQKVENVASEGILLLRSIIKDQREQVEEGEIVSDNKDDDA